ncbi:MAG: hypothetical protein E7663_06325 [Ruminococcaceae bacterium]|nr:hypothetical protein [Oscillospiraceae bacterium]
MEQIYTIPVNEAFDASAADRTCGCPMCALYRKLEENELDLILGASMMEPDIRIQTNKEGFCRTHYDMMFVRKNRLGMALTLESHLKELAEDLSGSLLGSLTGHPEAKPVKRIAALERSCYVCRRIEFHFQHMAETVTLLFDTDEEFVKKMTAQPYFCLPHYRLLLEKADIRLGKKKMAQFFDIISKVQKHYLDTLTEDISWFCKKFDYRYDQEPWKNSKDSVERAIKFLRSDLHGEPNKK